MRIIQFSIPYRLMQLWPQASPFTTYSHVIYKRDLQDSYQTLKVTRFLTFTDILERNSLCVRLSAARSSWNSVIIYYLCLHCLISNNKNGKFLKSVLVLIRTEVFRWQRQFEWHWNIWSCILIGNTVVFHCHMQKATSETSFIFTALL